MLRVVVLLLCASLPIGEVWAQGRPGSGGTPGTIGVAVVFPPDIEDVRMVAQVEGQQPVLFTNDGSFSMDLYGDGEWWAVVNPAPGVNVLRISGRADGTRVWHTETLTVPAVWMSRTYPVTLMAETSPSGWTLTRAMTAVLPELTAPTGAGVGTQAEQVGLSARMLYLLWGLLILTLTCTAVLRGAILRVREDPGEIE
jgi:hypothetical protein